MGASKREIGWLQRGAQPTWDGTPALLALYERARREPAWFPAALREHVFLFVPGIFTERYPLYFFQNRRRLEALGLRLREVPIRTEAPGVECARVIRDAVLAVAAEGRRCVLVGHSKGPLDAHAALVLHPETVPHTRALVSLQAPFGGTPLATDLEAKPLLRKLVHGAVRGLFGGSPQSFTDLTYAAREKFLERHGSTCPVPALSLVATTARAAWPLEHTRRYLEHEYGAQSDGFVAAVDAAIPGGMSVRLDGLDHAGLALRWLGRSAFEPAPLTQALLALVADLPLRPTGAG